MAHILTAYGEEYVYANNVDGVTLTVGVYNDSTDAISDANDIGDITTEPSNSNYSTASDTFTLKNPSGSDVIVENDNKLSYSFSDQSTSEDVDSYYVSASFQSTVVGADGSAVEHLLFTGALEQPRDIGSIDTLNVNAGAVELALE